MAAGCSPSLLRDTSQERMYLGGNKRRVKKTNDRKTKVNIRFTVIYESSELAWIQEAFQVGF